MFEQTFCHKKIAKFGTGSVVGVRLSVLITAYYVGIALSDEAPIFYRFDKNFSFLQTEIPFRYYLHAFTKIDT